MKKIYLFIIANTLTNMLVATLLTILLLKQYRRDKKSHDTNPATVREASQREQIQRCMAQTQEMLHNQEAMLDAAIERLDAITDILARMESAYKKGLGLWRFEYPEEQRDND